MRVVVCYGTESGNSELVADDVAGSLEAEHEVECVDLAALDPGSLRPSVLYLVVCSTHGDGELPQSAVPFADAARASAPDLSGIRYAMFGLGDRTYPFYSRGSEHIDELLAGLGAQRVGEYGRHDASGHDDASELAVAWAEEVISTAPLYERVG